MSERSKRQAFLGKDSEKTLSRIHVGIIGLGGGGSHVAQQLAHIGVGRFTLVDGDVIDETNLNRLIGGTPADVRKGTPKTTIAARQIRRVLATARVARVEGSWQESAPSLYDCDIIIGCLDTYAARLELETLCRRHVIPYVDLGMDVFETLSGFGIGGQVTLSLPGGPCLKCLAVVTEDQRANEAARYGLAGARPQVVWPNGVLASLAVGLVLQLFTPWHTDTTDAVLLEYDGNAQTVQHSTMLQYVTACPHFGGLDNIGDLWFRI